MSVEAWRAPNLMCLRVPLTPNLMCLRVPFLPLQAKRKTLTIQLGQSRLSRAHFTALIGARVARLDVSLTSGWPTRRAGLTTESLFPDAQARAPLRRHARLHELLVILVREGVEPLLQRPVRFDHPNGLGKRCNPVIHLFARLASRCPH